VSKNYKQNIMIVDKLKAMDYYGIINISERRKEI
jgi:hypothetical protein